MKKEIKRKTSLFILPVLLLVLAVLVNMYPVSDVEADEVRTYKPEDIIQLSQDNDLSQKLQDFNDKIKNYRTVYRGGGGLWGNIYSSSVAPYVTTADDKQTNYTNLNTKLTTELGYYTKIYNYWYAKESLKVNEDNKNLAEKDYEIAQNKYNNGVISSIDLKQAKASLNSSEQTYKDALASFNQTNYSMNSSIGNNLTDSIDIDTPEFSTISQDKLDINTVLPNILITHKSIAPYNAYLKAYNVALEAIDRQEVNNNMPQSNKDGLTDYYKQEIYGVNLQLQQKKQQIELACYNYVSQLNSLEDDIKTCQDNIEIAKDVYNKTLELYNLGKTTSDVLEQDRIKILSADLSLINCEKNYMLTKKQYDLFNEGYLGSTGSSASSGSQGK